MSTRALIPLIVVASLVVAQIWLDGRPPVAGRDAPPEEFSAQRAMDHLAQFAVVPHPMGSPANRQVADYLEVQVRNLGLELERLPGRQLLGGSPATIADLENLLVRLPGTDNSGAVLLTAHYDSVPGSPGASDDGAGVATLLESLRVLRAEAGLRNDILFLFTDGEEFGLLGARQFVLDRALLGEIGVVMNFEGRGNHGPVWLFETSSPNQWIVREFALASPFPVGNSLSYEIYKRLPNDTDFSVFKREGLPGFNFAHFGGITRYHTRLDNLSNLDPASLQHHGSYAVALSRQLGRADLSQIDLGSEVIYGNLIGNTVIYYPAGWILPLLLPAWILLVAAIFLAFRRGRLDGKGFLIGLGSQIILLAAVPLLVWGLWRLIWHFHPQRPGLVYGQPYGAHWWMMALVALGSVIYLFGVGILLRRFREIGVIGGIVTVVLLFSTALSWFVPGSHFLFFWPALGAVLGLLIRTLDGPDLSWPAGLGLAAVAFPASMLPAQAGQLHEALTLNLVFAPALVMIFFFAALSPHFSSVFKDRRLPRLGLVCALLLFPVAILSGSFAPARPRANSLFYSLEEESGAAFWMSTDSVPDSWTERFLEAPELRVVDWLAPLSSRPLLSSAAPTVPLPKIGIDIMREDASAEGARASSRQRLRVRVTPGAAGSYLAAQFDPGTRVWWARVQGLELPPSDLPGIPWGFRYLAPPLEGIEIELEIEPRGEALLSLVESRRGWPEALSRTRRRPPETMSVAYPYWLQDSTLVARQIRIVDHQ